MPLHAGLGPMRLAYALGLALLLSPSYAISTTSELGSDSDSVELSTQVCNSTPPPSSSSPSSRIAHIPEFTDQFGLQLVTKRQVSCPNPSTDQLCESGYCFLSQVQNGSTWGTCCPAGWSLWLNSADWSTQKCCPTGTTGDQCGDNGDGGSEAPLRPIDCGSGGVISGWACVYSSQNSNGVMTRPTWSKALVGLSGLIWLGIWTSGSMMC